MEEAMNMNGMGLNTEVPQNIEVAPVPVEENIVETEKKDIQEEVVSENISDTPVEENTTLTADNVDDFGDDMDMIKQLRDEEAANRNKNESIFSSMDFGALKKYLEDDDVTDISYSNGGQMWLKTLSKGVYRVDEPSINDALIEKIAFQCSNVMGKTFNMAHPFLDSESAELRMNFIHESIARNGIAVVFRKTPAKIRLEKDKLMKENYVSLSIHDFLIKAVQGHCNIIMCGETGSGKTEFLKYLASHTFENEKIVTVEDTLELHLDRIYPHRDIVAMKTNNVASYSDVLVTCMRQNPIWILLSEVRSAEAVTAVRNSISSGHFILSTIHADKAANIPYRLYSLLESNIDVEQFLNTIYRYVQLGVFLRGRFDPKQGRFVREIGEVTEFYVNDDNECISNTIYQKTISGDVTYKPISDHLLNYLEGQGIDMKSIRDANGDLEKAQSYQDDVKMEENIEEQKVEEEVKEEIQPEVTDVPVEEVKTIAEESVQPAVTEVQPVEVQSVTEVKEEPVVSPLNDLVQEAPVAPVQPVEAVQQVTEVKEEVVLSPLNDLVQEAPVAPVQPVETVQPVTEVKEEVVLSPLNDLVQETTVVPVQPVETVQPVTKVKEEVVLSPLNDLVQETTVAPVQPVATQTTVIPTEVKEEVVLSPLNDLVQEQAAPVQPSVVSDTIIEPVATQQPIASGSDPLPIDFTIPDITNIE